MDRRKDDRMREISKRGYPTESDPQKITLDSGNKMVKQLNLIEDFRRDKSRSPSKISSKLHTQTEFGSGMIVTSQV